MTSTSVYPTHTNASRYSLEAPSLPPYSEFPEDPAGPAYLSRSNSSESLDTNLGVPGPSQAPAPFEPTTQLQIQTPGKPWFSFPIPPRPDPIPIFSLGPSGQLLPQPLYLSIRPSRRSGSCTLVHADDEAETALSTTTYRFGVGRPPRIELAGPGADPDPARREAFDLPGRRLLTRAQRVETSLGTFEWRYARARERRAEAADSLLVFERVATAATAAAGQPRTRIAQLVRSEGLRSPGTSRLSAGNGGRLMLDLRGVDEKARERMQLLVVTTALVMLKKEVDRRARRQVATMSGGGGC